MKILVTGGTGYVGGRLVPKLLEAGHDVRVVAREPHRLDGVPWRDAVEIVRGDLLVPDDVEAAVAGQEALYYLVHSMSSAGDFEELERRVANTIAQKAHAAGVQRIVYLGGLHPEGPPLPAFGVAKGSGGNFVGLGCPDRCAASGRHHWFRFRKL